MLPQAPNSSVVETPVVAEPWSWLRAAGTKTVPLKYPKNNQPQEHSPLSQHLLVLQGTTATLGLGICW